MENLFSTKNGFRCPCGKCCMQQYLYGNCREKGDGFPCLDRTVLSRSEKRILVKRLTDQSEDIKIKFQRLVKSIKIWISENKPCFSPEQLKDFASKHPSVDIASDFETIYQELETCGVWTWFSFDYLKAVMQLCLPEGFDEYHEFIEECGDYCRRRLLECPHIMAGYEMEYQIPLFAKLRDGGLKVASLRSVGEDFVRKLATALGVEPRDLLMLTYQDGCTMLLFSLPRAVGESLFPLSQAQNELLLEMGVLECDLYPET